MLTDTQPLGLPAHMQFDNRSRLNITIKPLKNKFNGLTHL
jgi:hypothetical protein